MASRPNLCAGGKWCIVSSASGPQLLREVMRMPDQRKKKPSLIEIAIIMAILGILLSILGGKREQSRRATTRPPAAAQEAPQEERGDQGNSYFWRP